MPKAAKAPSAKHKFIVDYSPPAAESVFDGAVFEKYLHDRIKVDGKAGNLGDNIKIHREGNKLTITSNIPLSKRYIKYLTKKFVKKNALRDWIRVVATSKDAYQLRFYKFANPGGGDE